MPVDSDIKNALLEEDTCKERMEAVIWNIFILSTLRRHNPPPY